MKNKVHPVPKFKTTLMQAAFMGVVSLSSFSAMAQNEPYSDGAVRIGVLTDMNSVYANVGGQGAVLAARMAIDDFGKKSVNGARIELFSADDQNRQELAAQKTKEWIEKTGLDMITGMSSTSSALGAMSEASKHKKIVIPVGATGTVITNASCNPYTVHWMQDTYGLSVGTIKSLMEQGKKTYFFITADYAFGYSLEKDATDLIKRFGGSVKGSVKHPFPGSDFSEQLKLAKESGASVILFANAGLDATGITKQAIAMGINKNQTIAPLLLFHQDVQALGLDALQNQSITLGYVWNQDAESEKFARRFYERFKRMPDIGQAGVYSAVLNYLKAAESAGSDDGDAVMAKFHQMTINDAIIRDGHIRADGKLLKPMYHIRIKSPSESKGAWDYYDIKRVISAEEASLPISQSTCSFVASKPAVKPKAEPAKVEPQKAETKEVKAEVKK